MKQVKTLLINPPVTIEKLYGKFARGGSDQPPLSLCYIASYLLQHGKDVRILDAAKLRLSSERIMEEICEFEPDIIGFHTCTPYMNAVKSLTAEIKSLWPHRLVIAGGSHFLGDPISDIENSKIDVIVVGEGEKTSLEIVEGLEKHTIHDFLSSFVEKIKGVIYLKDGSGKSNPSRELIQDIDTIPHPARHLLPPLDTYRLSVANYKRLPATAMLTSRGCPFRCIFCINSILKEKVRLHSVGYVIEEVDELIERYKMREICFVDDVFTVTKNRTYQICEKLAKRKHKIVWSCNVKVGLVDKRLLKTMKESGCWMVMAGIESGSQKIIDTIKKNFKLEQAVELCNWCREVGLMIHPNFIIGHPGETEDTINMTIDFAKRLYSHYLLFTLMVPYPGTELWNTAEKYGRLKVDNFDYFTLGNENPCFVPYGLSEELLIRKRKEAYKKCYLNFSMARRHLSSIRSFEDMRRLFRASRILFNL